MNRLSFVFILLACWFCACKKEDENAIDVIPDQTINSVDYRDVLVGQYQGDKHHYSWMMGMPPNIYDTTYAYSFSITKDTSNNKIIADGYLFVVDSNLYCYELYTPGPIIRSFSFSNDTAYLYFRSGGLGGYSTLNIKGKKQ